MGKFNSGATMASSTLDSTAAFEDRAKAFGVESWLLDKLRARNLNTFGSFAFSIAHNPQVQNDKPFVDFMQALAETELEQSVGGSQTLVFRISHVGFGRCANAC